jgi:ribosome modulation factor
MSRRTTNADAMRRDLERMAAAFNAGSDAGIAGRPLSDNPYQTVLEQRYWNDGWHDVAFWDLAGVAASDLGP